jgi:hypothetical protein
MTPFRHCDFHKSLLTHRRTTYRDGWISYGGGSLPSRQMDSRERMSRIVSEAVGFEEDKNNEDGSGRGQVDGAAIGSTFKALERNVGRRVGKQVGRVGLVDPIKVVVALDNWSIGRLSVCDVDRTKNSAR